MDKTQILSTLKEQLNQGLITKQDLEVLLSETKQVDTHKHTTYLTNVFYIIGALIAIVGVAILIGQNWEEIGIAGRIISTLGISIATYFGALTFAQKQHSFLSQVFFVISAVLAPIGIVVLYRQYDFAFDTLQQVLVSIALAVLYIGAYAYSRKNILVPLAAIFLTWTYYATIQHFFNLEGTMVNLAVCVQGLSYLALGFDYQFKPAHSEEDSKEKEVLRNIFYGIGSIITLGSLVAIGGWWDFVTLALIFLAFYGSVYTKSKTMLAAAAGFLIGDILKITSKYFVNSGGWAFALIVFGFVIIGVGYGTIYINKKFIA